MIKFGNMTNMRYFPFGLFVVFSWCCSNSYLTERVNATREERYESSPALLVGKDTISLVKERAILKKYALCKCLIFRYPQDSFLRKDGALTGYEEIGSYGNKAYDAVDSLVAKWCRKKYSSKYKRNLYLMQCIDLYDSPELDSMVVAQDRYINLDVH
jgi:hypothetical protein